MGGLLAAYFAQHFPHRIGNLVLICPAGTPYKIDLFRKSVYLNAVHLAHRLMTLPVMGSIIMTCGIVFAPQLVGLKNQLQMGKRDLSFNSLADSCSKLKRVDSTASLRPEGERFLQVMQICSHRARLG